ncbi:MAG: pyridoxine 5'-phosphate synthase [Pseudomonadota bacterium]
MQPLFLGVNIDHVATLRQARGGTEPDPIQAALIAEASGADGITLHLREDRRHIQDRDMWLLKDLAKTRINFEMAVTAEMVAIALQLKPHAVCLVPERREELTTEGGLNVADHIERLKKPIDQLRSAGIRVSLFVDPDMRQLDASAKLGAEVVELHTGTYAHQERIITRQTQLHVLKTAAEHALDVGLMVHAGHGLNYHNVQAVAAIPCLEELNIGHSIMSRAIFSGLAAAVSEMKRLMVEARSK